jgi:hypothetical protein
VAEGLARALVELFEAEIEALAAPDHPVAPVVGDTQ